MTKLNLKDAFEYHDFLKVLDRVPRVIRVDECL